MDHTSGTRRWRLRVRRALMLGLGLIVGLVVLVIVSMRVIDPPGSMLMARKAASGTPVTHEWVRLERMSPQLITMTLENEDPRICAHWGVDWPRVVSAVETAEDGVIRDTSTIAMQLAKNLFLWPERSYVRKALEVPLAYAITLLLPRQRIVEIYLNIAEWGDGVFGAEAAARHHFAKSAQDLSAREAALLVAVLPNPLVRRAGRAGPRTRSLAQQIERSSGHGHDDLSCIMRIGTP
jgi:monofunctional biosynthetic peptidoglycan transglycosylase